MNIKALLLASAFAAAGIYAASAQTSSPPAAGSGSGEVSATTHCKDAVSGQVKLKSAAATSSPGSSASGSAGTSPGGTTTGAAGTSPSAGAPSGTTSPSSPAAANLPNC
jgi:hypothetical protein